MELNLASEENTNSNKSNEINNDENDLNRNMFEFNTVIGKGGFGKVWKVQYKKTKEFFALKEMSKRKILDKKSEKSINSERKFLSILNHPFIVNMHYAFQDNDNLYLVMDMLSGGDLRYHCSRYRTFSEEQTRFFIACIAYSLEYIHSNNVIHRDIKPENLVLDEKGYVRITDFGIAKYNTLDNSSETSGTPGYMSPEVMNAENHSFPADFFAVGVIGYEFLMGSRPYNGKDRKEIKEKIFTEKVEIKKDEMKSGWSDDVVDFINRLIERNKEERLGSKNGFQELKEHQWLKYYPWDELEKKILPAPFIPEKIDNFDKSYCESIERITEQTKLRYKKIFSSDNYKNAFAEFYFNKDKIKYQRRNNKQNNIIIKNINKENNNTVNNNNNETDNKELFIKEEINEVIIKNQDAKDNNNNEIKSEIDIKSLDKINENKEDKENDNKCYNSENNEGDMIDKKIELNSEEKNKIKSQENNNSMTNVNSLNSFSKNTNEINKYINQYNTNNIIQINNFKKIVINHNHNNIEYIKRKTNEDFFMKDYMKYKSNKKQNKFSNKFNYFLKLKKGTKHLVNNNKNKKSSSLIFNSSKNNNVNNINNNNSDLIINNQFPKKDFHHNHSNNKTIFKNFLLNNNNNNSNNGTFSNIIINNSKENQMIKYQKLKFKKKNNNSFRVNHIKKLVHGNKINMIKKIYLAQKLENQENINKKIDKNNNYGTTYNYSNISLQNNNKRNELKINLNEKKTAKLPLYINNYKDLSGDNSDNFSSNKINSNNNNDYIMKYANSLNNINYKDKNIKNINFNKNIQKFKLFEKNKIIDRNFLTNKSRTNSNIKLKNSDRINSIEKIKSLENKYDKNIYINKKGKKTERKILEYNSDSTGKDKFHYYLLS